MNKPIKIKINVAAVDEAALFRSEKSGAVYLDLVAWPVRESKYGETHLVKQDFGKDSDKNKDAALLGNLKLPDESQQPSRSVDPHGRDRTGYQTPVQAATPACKQTNDGNSEIPW
jgi:hypothetical protein